MFKPEEQERINRLEKELELNVLSQKITAPLPTQNQDKINEIEKEIFLTMTSEQKEQYFIAKQAMSEIVFIVTKKYKLPQESIVKIASSLIVTCLKSVHNSVTRNLLLFEIFERIQRTIHE